MRSHLMPGATAATVPGTGGASCGKLSAAVPPSCGLMRRSTSLCGSDALEYSGDALADADAHGDESVAGLPAVQFADRGERDARTRSAERVAQRDGAAV